MIPQFLVRADALGPAVRAALRRQLLLGQLGERSEIFGGAVAPSLARAVRPRGEWPHPAPDVAILQVQAPPPDDALSLLPPARSWVVAGPPFDPSAPEVLEVWRRALSPRVRAVILDLPAAAVGGSPTFSSPPLFDPDELERTPVVIPQLPGEGPVVVLPARTDLRLALSAIEGARAALGQSVRHALDTAAVPRAQRLGLMRAGDALLWTPGADAEAVLWALAVGTPVLAVVCSEARALLGAAGVQVAAADLGEALAHLLRQPRASFASAAEGRLIELREAQLTALAASLGRKQPTSVAEIRPIAPRFTVDGAFETSYSLDLLNRELARAIERVTPGEVALSPSHGTGFHWPRADALAQHPDLPILWGRHQRARRPVVVIRGMYPPRVADLRGRSNWLYFAWEESSVPPAWVDDFNRRLDGLLVLSQLVRKVLIDAGVTVPIQVVGCGIDHALRTPRVPYPGPIGRGFRFLHLSSAFPRKGVDVLLEAFAEAFAGSDQVSLVLKTFPNPHNEVEAQLAALRRRHPEGPEIVLINRDLPAGQVVNLLHRCDALVAPSRGEGFGLPLAEAMALGKPVITTAHGGQRDFCSARTAWLVDYDFAPAATHLGLTDSVWAEPRVDDLVRRLREVARAPAEISTGALGPRVTAAKALARGTLRWDAVATRTLAAIDFPAAPADRPLRLGWVTSWNTRCGIATYSDFLLRHLPPSVDLQLFASRTSDGPDAPNVHRCWDDSQSPDLTALETAIVAQGCEQVVLHFHFSFFDVAALGGLLRRLRRRGVQCVVIFHSTRELTGHSSLLAIASELGRAARLLVHGVADLNALKRIGLVENVTLFPHGIVDAPAVDRRARAAELGLSGRVIASYGFLRPNKGLLELVEAMPRLRRRHPDLALLMLNARYPRPDSDAVRATLARRITELGLDGCVRVQDAFLPDAESLRQLQAAELIVFPYQNSLESASGAVRFGLASGRPVACTPLEVFADVAEVVHLLPGTAPRELARGIGDLLTHPPAPPPEAWLRSHRWGAVARRLFGMLSALRAPDAAARSRVA